MNTEELQASYGDRFFDAALGDTRNSFERVREFHEVFGHPVADAPAIPNDDRTRLRLSLILEEALELADAMGFFAAEVQEAVDKMIRVGPVVEGNIVAIADALGDIEYVVNGAALEHGIPLPKVVKEIHASNMSKLGPNNQPLYREDGKVLKGANYTPPNLHRVLWD